MKKNKLKIKLPKINILIIFIVIIILILGSSLLFIFKNYYHTNEASKQILEYIDKVSLNKVDLTLTENVINKLNQERLPINFDNTINPFKKINLNGIEETEE